MKTYVLSVLACLALGALALIAAVFVAMSSADATPFYDIAPRHFSSGGTVSAGAAVCWNDPSNLQSVCIESPAAGDLRTCGSGGTNNECFNCDYETTANIVSCDSSTGVTAYAVRGMDVTVDASEAVCVNGPGCNGRVEGSVAVGSSNNMSDPYDFGSVNWTVIRATISANSTTAPDNTATADTLVEDNTPLDSHHVRQAASVNSGSTYITSVWAKAANRSWFAILDLQLNGGSYFNLDTCAAGSVEGNAPDDADCTDYGNGWCRCWIEVTASGTGSILQIYYAADSDGGLQYDGLSQDAIYLWGAQHEQGTGGPSGGTSVDVVTDNGTLSVGDTEITSDVNLFVAATKRLGLDGAGGDTFWTETSTDVVRLYVGGVQMMRSEKSVSNQFNHDTRVSNAAGDQVFEVFRNDATPTANDPLGCFRFGGFNDAVAEEDYGEICGELEDDTAAAEDVSVAMKVMDDGSLATYMTLDATDGVEAVVTNVGRIKSRTVVGDANYAALASDHMIWFQTAFTTGRTLTLNTALCDGNEDDGRIVLVKDFGAGFATNYSLTIATEGSETINGQATWTMSTDYESVTFVCSDTNWGTI